MCTYITLSCKLMSAGAVVSFLTTLILPCAAARVSAVLPSCRVTNIYNGCIIVCQSSRTTVCVLTLTCASISCCTALASPDSAALCRVSPSYNNTAVIDIYVYVCGCVKCKLCCYFEMCEWMLKSPCYTYITLIFICRSR